MLRRLVFLTVFLVSLCSSFSSMVTAQQATPEGVEVDGVTIVDPEEAYAGVAPGEWLARNWQWTFSLPLDVSPSFNPDAPNCGYGQSGPVFFLPANFTADPAVTTCIVPQGTAIFTQVGTAECSTVEPPPFFGRDEAELRACAVALGSEDIVDIEASVNGEPVPNLERYLFRSPLFTLTLPEDNVLGVPPGVALSVAEGYAFIIAPPSPGEYEVFVSVTFSDGFTTAVTTRVVVEAPQVIEPAASPATSPEATPVT